MGKSDTDPRSVGYPSVLPIPLLHRDAFGALVSAEMIARDHHQHADVRLEHAQRLIETTRPVCRKLDDAEPVLSRRLRNRLHDVDRLIARPWTLLTSTAGRQDESGKFLRGRLAGTAGNSNESRPPAAGSPPAGEKQGAMKPRSPRNCLHYIFKPIP